MKVLEVSLLILVKSFHIHFQSIFVLTVFLELVNFRFHVIKLFFLKVLQVLRLILLKYSAVWSFGFCGPSNSTCFLLLTNSGISD
jgi:hypothetical protein